MFLISESHAFLLIVGLFLGTAILGADSFGVGSGPIFLDEVDCSETDSTLLQCRTFSPLGIHSCSHSQDVAIICEGICTYK